MKYRVVTLTEISSDPDAIVHREMLRETAEPIQLEYHLLADVSKDFIELRNATIVPGGGIVWKDCWITGVDLHYYAPTWAQEVWRPGDFDERENTIDISDTLLLPDQVVERPVLFCDSHWASINFGHFVHDLLPYGRLFRQLRMSEPTAVPLMRRMSWPSQREILTAVFELPESEYKFVSGSTLVQRLFLARRQSMLDGTKWTTSFAGLRDARNLVLESFGCSGVSPVSRQTHPLKIFLHRTSDPSAPNYQMLLRGRNFANVGELVTSLMDTGFLAVEPGRVPIRLVARLVSRAHIVVGIHGANMGNILFGNPHMHVVEIRGGHGAWDDYAAVAAVLDQKHHAWSQPLPANGEMPVIDVSPIVTALSDLHIT